jgi:hypothetical protein
MGKSFSENTNIRVLTFSVIGIILLGLATTVFFMVVNNESYSALYIKPDSILFNANDNSVMYTFGVISTESGPRDYRLTVSANNTRIKTKEFSLNPGEILDERDRILLPSDMPFPIKISLQLTSDTSKEEVHFWIKE